MTSPAVLGKSRYQEERSERAKSGSLSGRTTRSTRDVPAGSFGIRVIGGTELCAKAAQ
jgi:hypothetical protein